MVEWFSQGVIRWRWGILIVMLLTAAVTGSGAARLEFSNDYRDYFSKKNPQLAAFEALQAIYTKADNVMFVIAPKDGNVFTRETLSAVERLTTEAWQLPYSTRVDSITNFQHTYANGDDLVVKSLVEEAASLTEADLDRIKRIALAEPLLVNRLIPPRAHVTGVNAIITLPERSLTAVPEVAAAARRLAERMKADHSGLEIYLTGGVMMDNAFGEYSRKDLQTLVPIMFGVILLVTFLTLRSVTGTFATLLVVLFAVITAMGITGWLGITLTAPSSTAPTVILTLAIADSIHILLTMIHGMQRGLEKRAALIESLRINFQPVFLTSLTTVIGFLTMNFSEVPLFRDLGNIVAIGVAAAWVYSILLLPALIAVLPLKPRRASSQKSFGMDWLGRLVVHRRKPLLWGMGLLTLTLLAFIPKNELNDQFVNYFDDSVDFRRATDFTVENLTGIYQIGYSIGAGESGGVSNPEYLRKLEEFAEWYRRQPRVIHVSSITTILKRLNKNMHGDDPAWSLIPDERELAAQYLLLYELSLPFGLDLNNQINVDKSATLFVVTTENLSSKEILALDRRAQAWLRENAPEPMWAQGAGPALMFAFIGERNIRSLIGGNVVALILVSATMILAMRSLRMGLFSLVPNLVPAGMAFGLWGLFHGEVGISLAVVTTMTFGIVVDDTIHFFSKYLLARREHGFTPEEAVRYAFSTVGTAMWVTSLILIAGFLVLTFSSFWLNSGMGLLTAVTIALALVADYLLGPPLLMQLDEKWSASPATATAVRLEEEKP
jgi:predicted RND superfamily exporter protein